MLRESPHTIGLLDSALELHAKGLRLVPLSGKRPVLKGWLELHLSESEIRGFARRRCNFGALTGDPLVVLDTDTEQAEQWVIERGIDSPTMVRSGRGGTHRYFRRPARGAIHSRQGLHGIRGLDVKGWRSFIVIPGSIHPETGSRYAFLPGRGMVELERLPTFDPAWLAGASRSEPEFKPRNRSVAHPDGTGVIRDIRRYIRSILSISGQGGHNACFRVACLLRDSGLPPELVWEELQAWNRECASPAWSERELLHKLRSVFQEYFRALL